MDIVKKYEPKKALYASEEGLLFYRKILESSKKYLNKKSLIAFEIGVNQVPDSFFTIFIRALNDVSEFCHLFSFL